MSVPNLSSGGPRGPQTIRIAMSFAGPYPAGRSPRPDPVSLVRRNPAAARSVVLPSAGIGAGPRSPAPPVSNRVDLLDLDLGAGSFQLSLELCGLVLFNAFLDRLRRPLHRPDRRRVGKEWV